MKKANRRIFGIQTRWYLAVVTAALPGLLALSGCGSTALTCSASASVVSGSTSAASSTVTLSNANVTMTGGKTPYTVSVPGLSAGSTSSTVFTYAGTFSTTASNGSVGSVTVVDGGNTTTTCALSLTGGTLSGTGLPTITASPSTSAAIGSTITLTAAATDGASSPTFTFSLLSAVSGVTLSQISSTQATVTSTINTSVTVNVSEYSNGTVGSSNSITLSFGSGGTSGSISLTASPSSTAAVGSSIVVTASDVSGTSNPTFIFSLGVSTSGLSLSQSGTNVATITSSVATSVTVNVTEYASGVQVATNSIVLNFTGTGSGSSLTCTLSAGGAFYSGGYTVIPNFITTSTGEAVQITNIYTTSQCYYYQGYTNQYYVECPIGTGSQTIQIYAQSVSRPGTYCNSGSAMTAYETF